MAQQNSLDSLLSISSTQGAGGHNRHRIPTAPSYWSAPVRGYSEWRVTPAISGRSRASTSSSRISPRATSRARNGGSARSTRSSRSMSTATRRCPMAAERHPRHPRRHAGKARLGPDPGRGPHHRAGRADRTGRDLARARRPVRAVRRPAGDDPPDLPRGQRPSGAGARDRRADGRAFPRARRQPEMDARRDAENAEVALRDHDALHAQGRHQGPRHDVPHLHDPGEPRLRARPTCAARCRFR